MIDLRPVFYGLAGAGRLVRLDISGISLMVGGTRGFWTSLYWSMALVAPLFILLMLLRYNPDQVGGWRYLFVNLEVYVLTWLAFPVIMERVCHFIDRRQRFLGFIIAYNWLACLYNTMYLLIGLAHAAGMIPFETAATISVILMAAGVIWIGFVTHKTLFLPISAAAGIVVIDLFLSIFMSFLSASLLAG